MGEKNALRGHDFHTKKRARFYIQAKEGTAVKISLSQFRSSFIGREIPEAAGVGILRDRKLWKA
jgi:hypothetical protein